MAKNKPPSPLKKTTGEIPEPVNRAFLDNQEPNIAIVPVLEQILKNSMQLEMNATKPSWNGISFHDELINRKRSIFKESNLIPSQSEVE